MERPVQLVGVGVVPRRWMGVSTGSKEQRVISMAAHGQRQYQSIGLELPERVWNRQWKHLKTFVLGNWML